MKSHHIALVVACLLALVSTQTHAAETASNEKNTEPTVSLVGRFVAVDNVCAWPNLDVLPDGKIVATIFGQPSHGRLQGDIACWGSSDGLFWEKLSEPTKHEAMTNRMNHAAGVDRDGKLVVLCSGWSLKREAEGNLSLVDILPAWSCISSDAKTWSVTKDALEKPTEGLNNYIPFGDIFAGEDGALHCSCYTRLTPKQGNPKSAHQSWAFRSDDGGKTWKRGSVIGDVHNETTIFPLGGKKWLAAARREFVELFESTDDCKTWKSLGQVTERNEINAHLQKLKDGRLLLTYGRRLKGRFGVAVRLSSDEGKTWDEPMTLVGDLFSADCGYPSSVQRPDGTIVTAYYSNAAPDHQRYHMGVALWNPPGDEKGE
jgi:Neuraminidase (sialidase)